MLKSARSLLVGAVIAGALVSAGAGAAQADTAVYYCNILVPAHKACSDIHTASAVKRNGANYNGAGTVRVCEWVASNGSIISSRCGNGYVDSGDDLRPFLTRVTSSHAANGSDYAHTILGFVLI